jgi:hypothetical protein
VKVRKVEQSRHCEALYDQPVFEEIPMTTVELELTTTSAATLSTSTIMKALVYHGPRKRAWEDKPRPAIQDAGDVIVRITTSTICGTDLHILKGDPPSVTEGRILGHEGIGVIEQVGTGGSPAQAATCDLRCPLSAPNIPF